MEHTHATGQDPAPTPPGGEVEPAALAELVSAIASVRRRLVALGADGERYAVAERVLGAALGHCAEAASVPGGAGLQLAFVADDLEALAGEAGERAGPGGALGQEVAAVAALGRLLVPGG